MFSTLTNGHLGIQTKNRFLDRTMVHSLNSDLNTKAFSQKKSLKKLICQKIQHKRSILPKFIKLGIQSTYYPNSALLLDQIVNSITLTMIYSQFWANVNNLIFFLQRLFNIWLNINGKNLHTSITNTEQLSTLHILA
jgi:hypothetical protein